MEILWIDNSRDSFRGLIVATPELLSCPAAATTPKLRAINRKPYSFVVSNGWSRSDFLMQCMSASRMQSVVFCCFWQSVETSSGLEKIPERAEHYATTTTQPT
ncbi:hypothetical protein ONS95_007948 [Cadophora gregata]|uniref:uncharacterized protein n=1 Tax=Cadophora gregata TaxID=51156 RepID=UPI0026DBA383|nr:uncharacterized protein ONS95_007948 [Cadophora gregata]KAK0126340.1 hypothetical protein ONS95_007948 [Cadophora gregata]